MRKSLKMKVGAVGATFAMAGALAVVASGTTGAFFSEAQAGSVNGSVGSVHLSTTNRTFAWTNMMPGEKHTAAIDFVNTGTGSQDFYIAFPNRPALHAFNQLGSYGEVHLTGGKTGAIVPLFDSMNLQDGRHAANGHNEAGYDSCGGFAPTGCWPLPVNLKIASNVGVGSGGSVSFGFNYAGRLGDTTGAVRHSGGPGAFNTYPLTALSDSNDPLDTVGANGTGLPFEVVAVQVGQTP